MKRVLVTGGAGFIGSHLAEALVRSGRYEVRVFDDLSTGRAENLAHLAGEIEVVVGDVRDHAAVTRAMRGVDLVSHQAALPSVPRSIADPATSSAVNVEGTLSVLTAARDAGVERVVSASSSSVYGNTPTLPKHEDMPTAPMSPYAVSKLTAELYTRVFADIYDMSTVALRYFNVFGPRQDSASSYAGVVAKFIAAARAGEVLTVNGDGLTARDFTYVDNVVAGNIAALESRAGSGRAVNVACGGRKTLLDLVAAIGTSLGEVPRLEFGPDRQGDVRESQAAIDLARELFGYEPTVGFQDGVDLTVRWFADTSRSEE